MKVTAATQLCLSIAARPGRWGVTVHNAAYDALGLDFLYKACAVEDLAAAVGGVRALGVRGCGVSMPFKVAILAMLDELDASAQEVGAANTVVNVEGRLIGYNTDVVAAESALRRVGAQADSSVLLLGAGGAARAVRCALLRLGITRVLVATRDSQKGRDFVEKTPFTQIGWEHREERPCDFAVNATPIGMLPEAARSPLSSRFLETLRGVVELVATPAETTLVQLAGALGRAVSTGPDFSLDQAAAQFELYTGRAAPREVMAAAMRSLQS
jgi:shikimate dehydrogenase